MDRLKVIANIGVILALADIVIRFFVPTFLSPFTTTTVSVSPTVMFIPAIAIVISLTMLRAKKFSVYASIIFSIYSLVAAIAFLLIPPVQIYIILPVLYLVVYGALSIIGLKEIKSFK